MSDAHDPACRVASLPPLWGGVPVHCCCEAINNARERIAQAIEAQCEADEPPCLGCFTAARIARNGGSDE